MPPDEDEQDRDLSVDQAGGSGPIAANFPEHERKGMLDVGPKLGIALEVQHHAAARHLANGRGSRVASGGRGERHVAEDDRLPFATRAGTKPMRWRIGKPSDGGTVERHPVGRPGDQNLACPNKQQARALGPEIDEAAKGRSCKPQANESAWRRRRDPTR